MVRIFDWNRLLHFWKVQLLDQVNVSNTWMRRLTLWVFVIFCDKNIFWYIQKVISVLFWYIFNKAIGVQLETESEVKERLKLEVTSGVRRVLPSSCSLYAMQLRGRGMELGQIQILTCKTWVCSSLLVRICSNSICLLAASFFSRAVQVLPSAEDDRSHMQMKPLQQVQKVRISTSWMRERKNDEVFSVREN